MGGLRELVIGIVALLAALAPPSAEVEPPETPETPETPEVQARARALGARFAAGRVCDPEAFVALRGLREAYGMQGVVGQALALAYRGCGDDVGWAMLFSARFTSQDSQDDQLRLAAALAVAHQWQQAFDVARPLAAAQGPDSRAAWLAGYALFELDDRSAAAPWLIGARATVDGKKRSDAPVLLALVQLELGDTDAAKAELRGAIERMPDEAAFHVVLARIHTELGETDAAARAEASARTLSRAAEAKARAQARLQALEQAWNHASDDDVPALVDRIVAEGPPDEVAALLERRIEALGSTQPTLVRRLHAQLRSLRR